MEEKPYSRQNDVHEYRRIKDNIITPIYISASNIGFMDWEKRNYEAV